MLLATMVKLLAPYYVVMTGAEVISIIWLFYQITAGKVLALNLFNHAYHSYNSKLLANGIYLLWALQ